MSSVPSGVDPSVGYSTARFVQPPFNMFFDPALLPKREVEKVTNQTNQTVAIKGLWEAIVRRVPFEVMNLACSVASLISLVAMAFLVGFLSSLIGVAAMALVLSALGAAVVDFIFLLSVELIHSAYVNEKERIAAADQQQKVR